MRKRFIGFAVAAGLAASMFTGTAAQAAGKATINVVHGIPGVNVAICVDGAKAIPAFAPGDVATGVILPSGAHALKVVAQGQACDAAAILSADVTLANGGNYTVVANLDADGAPNLKVFSNAVGKTNAGKARLTVRHTAQAPAVNVWANGVPLITGSSFTWGDSATLQVPKGIYAAWVSLPGDFEPVIGPAVLRLKAGFAYQVYAWGSGAAGYHLSVVAVQVGTK